MRPGAEERMRTIVSITPLPAEADSRALKIAASLGRAGFRSILVEGAPSAADMSHLPFQLVSPPAPRAGAPAAARGRAYVPRLLRGPARAAAYVAREMIPRVRARGRLLPAADLYYLHAYDDYPALAWVTSRTRTPYVYDAHDVYAATAPTATADAAGRLLAPVARAIERRCVRRASGFVTVGPGIADELERSFRRRPAVVRNVHDARDDQIPAGPGLRARLGLGREATLAVVIGNAKSCLLTGTVLEAARLLDGALHVAFLGRRHDALRSRAEQLGVGAFVHVLGPVDPREVVPTCREADLSVLPHVPDTLNAAHALPNGLFQSIAAGLPIVHGELVELSALCREHGCGVEVDMSSPERLAEALRDLIRRPEQRATLQRAAARASASLSWAREEGTLFSIVEAALEGKWSVAPP